MAATIDDHRAYWYSMCKGKSIQKLALMMNANETDWLVSNDEMSVIDTCSNWEDLCAALGSCSVHYFLYNGLHRAATLQYNTI